MNPDIERIYKQFLEGRCSRADAEWLLDYFQSRPGHADLVTLIEQELNKPILDKEYDPVDGFSPEAKLDDLRRRMESKPIRRRMLHRWLPYAAAVLVIVSVMTWGALKDSGTQIAEVATEVPNDFAPGGNRAMLTLADGRTIDLNENQDGIIVGEGIRYQDGSEVLDGEIRHQEQKMMNVQHAVLTTPKGGTYQVKLSDGTRVWLNAASSLRYPENFTGKERIVEIVGEGYFAVAKDRNKPFKVISQGQTIEVLGTEFNISAYEDDAEIKTTLVEGAVRLLSSEEGNGRSYELMPGQQAVTRGATTNIQNVDVSQYTAWKSGMFHFKGTPLKEVMNQIERWYDVEVVYKGRVPNETFGGKMRRNVSLLTVLDLLKASEINFYIDGHRLIIE